MHRAASRSRTRHPRRKLSPPPKPVLEFDRVTARTPGGRMLLDDVSFAVPRGSVVAVVGPTGVGKTSLARALTGSLALESGAIRLHGVDIARDEATGDRRVAYVPQDDVLHGHLDLARTIGYAASLRMPRNTPPADRDRRVASVLSGLGLRDHAHVPIATLSGGQRKRANIAAELVGDPDVLVLDEPTSGLDPGYEKAVFATLRELADAGRTVIAVTHSMKALAMCDRVLFLAAGGRVAFFGPPAEAAEYFGRTDAADVFLALDTEPGDTWQRRFRDHPAYARYVTRVVAAARAVADSRRVDVDSGPPAPKWREQLRTLVCRQVAIVRSDRRHLALLALQGPLLGLLLWTVLAPDSLHLLPSFGGPAQPTPAAQTVAMFVALSATWLGASNAVREIVKERHIVRREIGVGLSPSAYVASKAIVLGALTMAQSFALATIACLGQRPPSAGAALGSGRLEIALAASLAGLAAVALGLLLSSIVTTPDKALTLLPMTLVTELVLAGGWAAMLATPGLQQLRDLTGARWAVDAINATVAGDATGWWVTVIALIGLAGASLVATVALLGRQMRPAGRKRPALQLTPAWPPTGVRAAAIALGVAVVCAGGVSLAATAQRQVRDDQRAASAPVVAPVLAMPTAPAADVNPSNAAPPEAPTPEATPIDAPATVVEVTAPAPVADVALETATPTALAPVIAITPPTVPPIATPPTTVPTAVSPTTSSAFDFWAWIWEMRMSSFTAAMSSLGR